MSEQTQLERSYRRVLGEAQEARKRFIALTYDLPEGAPKEILRLWAVVDMAMFEFVRALQALAEPPPEGEKP